VIAVIATAPEHGPDVGVDRFDFPEGDLLVAVVQDAGQMPHQQRAQLLERRQSLPPEREEPVGEEAVGRALLGVSPELGELLLEQIRLGLAAVESEQAAEGFALLPVKILVSAAAACHPLHPEVMGSCLRFGSPARTLATPSFSFFSSRARDRRDGSNGPWGRCHPQCARSHSLLHVVLRSLVDHDRIGRRSGRADHLERRPDEGALEDLLVDERLRIDIF